MLIALGLVLAALVVITGAYQCLRLWLVWMDVNHNEKHQVQVEVEKGEDEKPFY